MITDLAARKKSEFGWKEIITYQNNCPLLLMSQQFKTTQIILQIRSTKYS